VASGSKTSIPSALHTSVGPLISVSVQLEQIRSTLYCHFFMSVSVSVRKKLRLKIMFIGCLRAEFVHLLKLLWNSRSGLPDSVVSPVKFKDKIAEFAKRFVGYR